MGPFVSVGTGCSQVCKGHPAPGVWASAWLWAALAVTLLINMLHSICLPCRCIHLPACGVTPGFKATVADLSIASDLVLSRGERVSRRRETTRVVWRDLSRCFSEQMLYIIFIVNRLLHLVVDRSCNVTLD